MAYGVTADVKASIRGRVTKANDIASVGADFAEEALVQIEPGTGTGYADVLWSDERSIAASSTENLDLAGVLADVFGATVAAAKVKAIQIQADADNANNVVVFGAASNAFNGPLSGTTPKITLEPGQHFQATSEVGWTVTAGSADIILVANSGSGTPVVYRIALLIATA